MVPKARFLVVFLLFVAGSVQGQTDGFEATRAMYLAQGDLRSLGAGSPPAGTLPASYDSLIAGKNEGQVFEFDCLPVRVETEGGNWSQVLAFPTDETGFGYEQDQPVVLLASHPVALDQGPLLRVLAVRVWTGSAPQLGFSGTGQAGLRVPVLRVLASVSHSSWD